MAFTVGCRTPEPPARRDEPPAHQPEVTPLARAGGVKIHLPELSRAVEHARMLQHWRSGERPSDLALSSPDLRRTIVEQALDRGLIRAEVSRRVLLPAPEELSLLLESAAAGFKPEQGLAPTSELPTLDRRLAERFGDVALIRAVAEDVIAARLLTNALVAALTESEAEARFRLEQTRRAVDWVKVSRVPTTAEIDEYVRTQTDAFGAWYAAHDELFNSPPRRTVDRVFFEPRPGEPGQDRQSQGQLPADRQSQGQLPLRGDPLHQAAAAARALIEAGQPFEAVGTSPGARFTRRALSQRQFAPAFALPIGVLSPVTPSRDGFLVFRSSEEIPGHRRALDELSTQREIAAALRRERDDLPHARSVGEQARLLLLTQGSEAGLATLAKAERLGRGSSPTFDRTHTGIVPGIGLALPLFDAIFKVMKVGETTPVLAIRQDYFVARVTSVIEPEPGAWEQARGTYVEAYRASRRRGIMSEWLSSPERGEKAIDIAALGRLPLDTLLGRAPSSVKLGDQ